MSITYNEVKDSPVKQKFYSELLDVIYTRSKIIKIITWDWDRISDEDNFNDLMLRSKNEINNLLSKKERGFKTEDPTKYILPFDLVKLDSKPFRRWDKYESRMRLHSGECELSESCSCNCWCMDLYHGLKYQRLPDEIIR